MREVSKTRLAHPGWRALFLLCVASLPWLARDFFQLPALAFDNFTDAVFYPSYATNFSELVLRHGFLYYAMRFGVIFPDALFYWIFGNPLGLIILRTGLQSVLLVLIYLFFEKRGGWVAGAIAVLLWWTSPVALRGICTTYLDSLAVPIFVLGTLLLAWPGARTWMALLAGILWGLAASSHLYLLILMPAMLPFIVGNRWPEATRLGISFAWALVGALLAWGCAYAYYRGVWSVIDLWAPTRELMGELAGGQTELWKSPLADALERTPAWFAPFGLLAGIGFLLRRGALPLWGAWLSLAVSAAFFWLGDLVGGAYALSMPFYFSLLWPAVFLAAASGIAAISTELCAPSCGRKERILRTGVAGILLCGLFLVGASSALTRIMTAWIAWTAIVLVGLIFLAAAWFLLAGEKKRFAICFFLMALFLSQSLVLATPFFSQFLAQYKRLHREDLWQPTLAAQLSQILPPAALDGGVLRFWFDDAPGGIIRMVQASQLHRFSMLPGDNDAPAGFPRLSTSEIAGLEASGVDWVVILDESQSLLDEAREVLLSREGRWRAAGSGVLAYRGKKIQYSVLQRIRSDHGAGNLLEWSAQKPAKIVPMVGGDRLLRSSSRRWMFEASAPLPESPEAGTIVFHGQVLEGRFLLVILDEADATVASTELWPTRAPLTRTLSFSGEQKGSRLVLRNMMPEGTSSELLIQRTEFFPEQARAEASESSSPE